jgi:hypothetical protein
MGQLPAFIPKDSRRGGFLPGGWLLCWLVALLCLGQTVTSRANEWDTFRHQSNLTPEKLLHYFATFDFELGTRVQSPETFLERRRGDCDDFATLASTVLTERGYSTKLIAIMMDGQTHVVCYVKEARGFLDFNHRADVHPVIQSDDSLNDIAAKVASYFRNPWLLASEIRYEGDRVVFLESSFPPARMISSVAQVQPNPVPDSPGHLLPAGSEPFSKAPSSKSPDRADSKR